MRFELGEPRLATASIILRLFNVSNAPDTCHDYLCAPVPAAVIHA